MQPVTESDINSRMMIQNKQKITPTCGVLLCKWSEISVSSGISLSPSLVTINPCCALWFFYLHYLLYPAWQVTALQRPLICILGTAFLCLLITYLLNCCENHSHLWIANVLACKVLNRNTVFTSILLRFAFVSPGFYRIFTNMLRIHLFFSVWQQKHCCSLKSHSLSLDFHNYKHGGKKLAWLLSS